MTWKKIVVALLSVLVVIIKETKGSVRDPADGCIDLMLEVFNCTSEIHIPEACKKSRPPSNFVTCAEEVLKKLPQCSDEIGQKILENYLPSYKSSDDVVCQPNIHAELMKKKHCKTSIAHYIKDMALMTPGFLTEKGCGMIKTKILVAALNVQSRDCVPVIQEFISAMYNESFCSKVEVASLSNNDIINIIHVRRGIDSCWDKDEHFPYCNSTGESRLAQCIENAIVNRLVHPHITALDKYAVSVAEKTNYVICNNKQLKTEFELHYKCFRYARLFGITMLRTEYEYHTEEGCQSLKYVERMLMPLFRQINCHQVLEMYWSEMNKALPCTGVKFFSNSSDNCKFSLSVYLVIILIMTVKQICTL